ncbi:MAG: hypothetical protein JO166_21505 [Deltaproteobacteria bacterium]|nr:hypothetical protein [Deltaproteobacteria bacterium]
MKVRTELRAGKEVAVAVGAAAVNVSSIHQRNSSKINGSYNLVAQANVADVDQFAAAKNTGAVSART